MTVKVSNMVSPRSGREVANQFVIKTNEGVFFQSYNSTIAFVDADYNVTLGRYFDYSVTTSKYLNQFLKRYAGRAMHIMEKEIHSYKSFSDFLTKGIENGIIKYDEDME